jgi:RNA polymerase sigma factor (sigma-70 family)
MRESDSSLIARFLGGDSEAAESVSRWVRGAAGSFRSRLGQDWDDAVQEAQLETTRLLRAGKFRGESGLVTYVWRVTIRRCMDALSRRATPVPADDQIASGGHSPLDRVISLERQKLAKAVVDRMGPECLDLWRRIAAGESYQAMGRDLGVAEGALRVRALRCRRRAMEIRAQLEQGKEN